MHEVAVNPVQLPSLESSFFSDDGLEVSRLSTLVSNFGHGDAPRYIPTMVQAGVQQAEIGVIQDPAGSAIGAGVKPASSGAGGASGAIYAAFPDLEPIPEMQPRSAIFNASQGEGKRILHTHSPRLHGAPASPTDRARVLEDIANAYANAILAFNQHGASLGKHGETLNLVPVSAGIFAGSFRNPKYSPAGHLDPSYTLAAILIAAGELIRQGHGIPELTLYYFPRAVCEDAREIARQLGSSAA